MLLLVACFCAISERKNASAVQCGVRERRPCLGYMVIGDNHNDNHIAGGMSLIDMQKFKMTILEVHAKYLASFKDVLEAEEKQSVRK